MDNHADNFSRTKPGAGYRWNSSQTSSVLIVTSEIKQQKTLPKGVGCVWEGNQSRYYTPHIEMEKGRDLRGIKRKPPNTWAGLQVSGLPLGLWVSGSPFLFEKLFVLWFCSCLRSIFVLVLQLCYLFTLLSMCALVAPIFPIAPSILFNTFGFHKPNFALCLYYLLCFISLPFNSLHGGGKGPLLRAFRQFQHQ